MTTEVIWLLVAWFSLPTLMILVALLIWRRAFREFPVFFSYAVVSFLVTLVRLLAYQGTKRTYFYSYWISEVVLVFFALLATYELFAKRLFPRFYAVRFYRRVFPAATIVIALLAVFTAFASTGVILVFIKAIHGVDFLRVTILFIFIVLMLLMGREWSRYEFGIALGFGVDAAAFLTSFAIWTKTPSVQQFLDQLPVIAYDIACIIWIVTFAKPEKDRAGGGSFGPELLDEARKWEETLKGSLTGKDGSN